MIKQANLRESLCCRGCICVWFQVWWWDPFCELAARLPPLPAFLCPALVVCGECFSNCHCQLQGLPRTQCWCWGSSCLSYRHPWISVAGSQCFFVPLQTLLRGCLLGCGRLPCDERGLTSAPGMVSVGCAWWEGHHKTRLQRWSLCLARICPICSKCSLGGRSWAPFPVWHTCMWSMSRCHIIHVRCQECRRCTQPSLSSLSTWILTTHEMWGEWVL